MTRRPRIAAIAALALLAAGPSRAEPADSADLVRGELRPGWRTEAGSYLSALHLAMQPGWKTYWRAPGEAGIPPVFDWAGSRNVAAVHLHWPTPRVFHTNGMRSIGYHDALVLPLEVVPADPAKPVHLALSVDMGVCLDICVPATVAVAADLSGPGAPDPAIAAALDDQPRDAGAAGLTRISCTAVPISDGWRVTATLEMPRLGPDETVAVETGQPGVWVGEAASARDGGRLTATADLVPGALDGFALDRSALRVTVIGDGTAMDVTGCPAP